MIESFLPDTGLYVQLVRFLVVLALGSVFTRVALMPLTHRLASRRGRSEVSVHSIENIVGISGLFLSFIFALQAAELGNLVTVLGAITAALTVAVGFGMRDQIGNVVAGFFIYTDHPFIKGDYISSEKFEGIVKEIKLRHTVINGASSEKVVLPNGMLTTQPLRNFTRGNKTKTDIEFKVVIDKVEDFEKLCVEQASENEKVLENPEPETTIRGLEDDKAIVALSYWLKNHEELKNVRSDVSRNIMKEAVEQKIMAVKKEEKEE